MCTAICIHCVVCVVRTPTRSLSHLERLRELRINDNQLVVLPMYLGNVTSLELLDMSSNAVSVRLWSSACLPACLPAFLSAVTNTLRGHL